MFVVIARNKINPGCADKFIEVVKDLIPIVRSEDGCISYDLCRDVDPETREEYLTFVEEWQSAAHHKAHIETSHMAEFRTKVKDFRCGSNVMKLERI